MDWRFLINKNDDLHIYEYMEKQQIKRMSRTKQTELISNIKIEGKYNDCCNTPRLQY